MSLLAPLFLLGLAAIALPVWLHRLHTESPVRQSFSSTMLLEQSRQRVHLRKKLQYITLLSLRVLFLALLVLAFAKPVFEQPPGIIAGEGAVLHLVVMDTSLSMGHGDWFANARDAAREVIEGMAENDAAQIVAASNGIEIIGGPGNDRAELVRRINDLEPGTGRLDLGALIANLDRLIRDYQQNVTIHLISDFQKSGQPTRFADLIPDALKSNATGLELHQVAGARGLNLFVDSVRETKTGLEVVVRGNNTEPVETRVAVRVNGETRDENRGTISESGRVVFELKPGEYAQGENRVEAALLREDPLPVDNVRYAVVVNTPPRPVLLITASKDSLPVKYLTAAVEAGRQGYRVEPVQVNELDPRIVQRYPWLIIDDLGIVGEALAGALTEYLNAGGAVFAATGQRTQTLQSLPLAGFPVKLQSAAGQPHSVARIDSSHPVLAETSGWRDISISRALALETGGAKSDTLVSLDNGVPLLLEQRFGPGRLLLLTTSLNNDWNDIPIRPVFVNFMAEAAIYLSGEDQLKRDQVAGDYLQLLQSGAAAGQVIDPSGRNLLSLADTHRSQDIKLNQTGFYEIYTTDSELLIAVNPDLRESNLTLMSGEALNGWREAATGVKAPESVAEPVDMERDPFELWHLLLVVLGLVLLAESVLGNSYLASGRGHV